MNFANHTLNMCLRAITLFCCASSISYAAVVMTGTRVIFPSQQNEKTIHLQNKDKVPNIVQIWVDEGDEASTPNHAKAPFVANPQIFKILPNQGQMVRLLFTGQKSELPDDRESIFYLNFSEIPASNKSHTDKNKLLVVFKNRVKIFYRPARLSIASHEISNHLTYSFTDARSKINIKNNSPYFANIAGINFVIDGKQKSIQKNSMIPPFSSQEWNLPTRISTTKNISINVHLINDYGVIVKHELKTQTE